MRHLKTSIVYLILGLTILFNIKRLNFEEGKIDILPLFYALGFAVALIIILFPLFRRINLFISLILWNALGLLLKAAFFAEESPVFGDINTYLTITELSLLSIIVVLAHQLARNLSEFEEAVENMTLATVGRQLRELDEAAEDIQTELIRSRRHHHPLSVIIVEPEAGSVQAAVHRSVLEVQRAMMSRYVVVSLGRAISGELRRTDTILQQSGRDRFIVFCPETSAPDALVMINRIKTVAEEKIGVRVACGIGAFPEDALTFEELVRQAELQVKQPALSLPEPAPLAPADSAR